jgi:hypothetical protein
MDIYHVRHLSGNPQLVSMLCGLSRVLTQAEPGSLLTLAQYGSNRIGAAEGLLSIRH